MTISIQSILLIRYLCVVVVTLILYDHFLTLDREIKYIWLSKNTRNKNRRSWSWFLPNLQRCMFVVNRYVPETMAGYGSYVFLGHARKGFLDDTACRRFIWVYAMLATTSMASTQFAVVYQVTQLCGSRRELQRLFIVGFIISTSAAVASVIYTVIKAQPLVFYFRFINMCGGVEIPKTLACVYGSTLVFEIFMTSSVIYNALETPHRKKSDVVANVLKDGAKLLFALLLFRIFCLLTSIIGDPSQVFSILSIGWAINSIIVGRIHLRLLHLLSLRADTSENNDHERDRVRLTGADASSRTRNDEERGVLERDEGCDNDNDTIEDTMVMTPRLPQMAQYPFVNS